MALDRLSPAACFTLCRASCRTRYRGACCAQCREVDVVAKETAPAGPRLNGVGVAQKLAQRQARRPPGAARSGGKRWTNFGRGSLRDAWSWAPNDMDPRPGAIVADKRGSRRRPDRHWISRANR